MYTEAHAPTCGACGALVDLDIEAHGYSITRYDGGWVLTDPGGLPVFVDGEAVVPSYREAYMAAVQEIVGPF